MNLFGFQITRGKKEQKAQIPQPTPITPVVPGASARTVSSGGWAYGGVNGWDIDLDGTFRTDAQLTSKYRDLASYMDVANAVDIICNEAIIVEQGHPPVEINTDYLPEQYQAIKDSIQKQFDQILSILNFNDECYDLFKRWYIDGKLFFYVMIDPKDPKKGIKDLKYIDPRKIRKVIEYQKTNQDGVDIITDEQTYYIFNDNGLTNAQNGIKISEDSIINVKSGLVDASTGNVLSYLYKAIKPANQLKMMEDALVIYRITRAPERRVFYVDVGNLPAQKAEQYVAQMMQKFRNKVVYDAGTGEVKNSKNHASLCEDFFLPRREGGKATEIQTLPGGSNLSQLEDVEYFQRKLYQSLNVPRQRLISDNLNALGRTNEITREEIAFSKFIQRLRNNFNTLFKDTLRLQLILTKTIKPEEWDVIKNGIYFKYQHDNYFEEMKRLEVMSEQMNQLQQLDSFKGTYFSKNWIVKHVLDLSDDEWEEMKEEIKQEAIEEAQEQQELAMSDEMSNTDESDEDNYQGDDEDSDDSYDDFKQGNDEESDEGQSPKEVDQTGDNTETITNVKPNPGDKPFNRPATPGLTAGR